MAGINRDDVEKFFDYGVYIPSRTIYIGSNNAETDEVNEKLSEKLTKGLHILETHAQYGDKPINIILNTPGGEEYHGLGIYDLIRECNNHVTIKVVGQASSMGSIILQAGDERVLSENSIVMIHYGTPIHVDPDATPKTNYNWVEESKRFDKWMEDLYLEKIREKHPRFERKKLKTMLEHDTIISAYDTVALGLADRVEKAKVD